MDWTPAMESSSIWILVRLFVISDRPFLTDAINETNQPFSQFGYPPQA